MTWWFLLSGPGPPFVSCVPLTVDGCEASAMISLRSGRAGANEDDWMSTSPWRTKTTVLKVFSFSRPMAFVLDTRKNRGKKDSFVGNKEEQTIGV